MSTCAAIAPGAHALGKLHRSHTSQTLVLPPTTGKGCRASAALSHLDRTCILLALKRAPLPRPGLLQRYRAFLFFSSSTAARGEMDRRRSLTNQPASGPETCPGSLAHMADAATGPRALRRLRRGSRVLAPRLLHVGCARTQAWTDPRICAACMCSGAATTGVQRSAAFAEAGRIACGHSRHGCIFHGSLAQLAAQRIPNPKVEGSTPSWPATFFKKAPR